MNIPNIILNALATANTPSATADSGSSQAPIAFSSVLDAAGKADASVPVDAASHVPVAEKSDSDDNGGVADSVAASIILLFSGFEFPANTIPPLKEPAVNAMPVGGNPPVGEDLPVTDSSFVAAGYIADTVIQMAAPKQTEAVAEAYPEVVNSTNTFASPNVGTNTFASPNVSTNTFTSADITLSAGMAAKFSSSLPTKQSGADSDPAIPAVDDAKAVHYAGQSAFMQSQQANVQPEPIPERETIITPSNVSIIESSVKAAIPATLAMPDGASIERSRVNTSNAARQKHGEIKYEGEAPDMRIEAIFTETGAETTIHNNLAAGNSMETIGRQGLPAEKHDAAEGGIMPGNISAISAYETVRAMDTPPVAESAEVAESADTRFGIVEQLQEPVTRAITRGADHIRLRLQPEGLGDLRVNIRMVDGGVRLEIITDKILSRQILEQGLPELQSLMRDDGISLKSVRVEYGGADDRETPRRRDEHPPYRQGHGKRRENFAGYFA